ncbi:hypothetical protein RIF23_18445 [Lipingzhangella sp. LS1_29]|uniref:DUF4352 domain-containing protein n=1 Tax=Lipingzhangella rawalii TaxID=2055835 RepID=A0ABU2HAD4_9ACTN|nr:hypothetical protein [Lipingzhangella rawalii]MDS1272273.1 hypothetical protein [Lipingzhangella rawalii]
MNQMSQPGFPPNHEPAQGPPRRTSFRWMWLGLGGVLVLAVVAAIVFVALSTSADESEPDGGVADDHPDADAETDPGAEGDTQDTTDTDAEADAGNDSLAGDGERQNPELPGLNEEVTHEGLVFTVTGVETGVQDLGGYPPPVEYVVLHVDVASDTGEQETFRTEGHRLYTPEGDRISEDFTTMWLNGDTHRHDLAADGTPVSVEIAFSLPDEDFQASYVGLSTGEIGPADEVEIDLTG